MKRQRETSQLLENPSVGLAAPKKKSKFLALKAAQRTGPNVRTVVKRGDLCAELAWQRGSLACHFLLAVSFPAACSDSYPRGNPRRRLPFGFCPEAFLCRLVSFRARWWVLTGIFRNCWSK